MNQLHSKCRTYNLWLVIGLLFSTPVLAQFRSISQEQQLVYLKDGSLKAAKTAQRVDGIELDPGFANVVTEAYPQSAAATDKLQQMAQANEQILATPVTPLPASYYASRMQPEAKHTCNPTRGRLFLTEYSDYIRTASQRFGVEEPLIRAIIHAESAFKPTAKSNKKAQGLMQIIPATATRLGLIDPYNPYQNIQAGAKYLSWLLNRYNGDIRLAAAGYNAGEGAVDRYGGIPPYKETINYVSKVTRLLDQYRTFANPALADIASGNFRIIC